MHAVVTGGSGFVGRALMSRWPGARHLRLSHEGWRSATASANYASAVVVHLAARVHQAHAPWAQWHADNVEKTEVLAQAAARGGASRFVFMSTLKVHGEETAGHPYRASDAPHPSGDYARSKALAESRLQEISRETGLPVTVVRAPLIFGRGAGANLGRVVRLAASGLPLPFAAVGNRRSWVHVDDLCALLDLLAGHPDAAGRAFIAAHPQAFSTPELISGLRTRMGHRARLFAAPRGVLEAVAALAGQAEPMRRLTRSLEGDPREALELGWRPARDFASALSDLVPASAA